MGRRQLLLVVVARRGVVRLAQVAVGMSRRYQCQRRAEWRLGRWGQWYRPKSQKCQCLQDDDDGYAGQWSNGCLLTTAVRRVQ
jgi:hypothetical protein